ncbi:hypothetical protein C8J57DRAFT_1305717 [Mycena rebaudengoi]|nr:hypothetical protein C8J57DRAFT_1305717 [Mycena rebaudengoi]
MASDYLLSSLSAYTAVVAVPIGLAALVLTEKGWNMLTSMSRGARTTIRPSEGHCQRRLWEDLAVGPLHVCTSVWPAQCHCRLPHDKGPRCWEGTLTAVPKALPVSIEFLHVDLDVVLAFVFLAVKKDASLHHDNHKHQRPSRTIRIGDSVLLDTQTVKPGLAVVHLEGNLERTLTKDYVNRLLAGSYPPLVDDPQNMSVVRPGDEARGGWVAAFGLVADYSEENTFLPVYLDDGVQYRDRRGHVFWRSMDRVRNLLTDVWAQAFAADPAASRDIAVAVRALTLIHDRETESGVEHFFDLSMPSRVLSAQERDRIIQHFNGPPLLPASQEQQFRQDWEPLIHYVLVAAVRGSVRCIAYFKNPGRELENILPMDVLRSASLYVRGC